MHNSQKYPRTMHLPFSPGSTSDDKFMTNEVFNEFAGHELVYTEKLDGSNVCLTSSDVFSRSHNGPPGHISFDRLKLLHSVIRNNILDDLSIFGEWCFAVHSIKYSMLQHHLNVFGIRDDLTGEWWDWDDVSGYAGSIGVPTVPVILRGAVKNSTEIKNIVENFASLSSVYGPTREGLVIRRSGRFTDVGSSVGKYVRKDHVQTDEHWTRKAVQKQPSMILI
jgi:hypothetical protein